MKYESIEPYHNSLDGHMVMLCLTHELYLVICLNDKNNFTLVFSETYSKYNKLKKTSQVTVSSDNSQVSSSFHFLFYFLAHSVFFLFVLLLSLSYYDYYFIIITVHKLTKM